MMKRYPALRAAAAALLTAATVLAAGCSRAGPVPTGTIDTAPADPTAAPVTTTTPPAVKVESAPSDAELMPNAVRWVADGFAVYIVPLPAPENTITVHPYDNTHLLFYTYADERQHLYLFDTEAGKFVADCPLDAGERLLDPHYTDAGIVLFHRELQSSSPTVYTMPAAVTVSYANGKLTAVPTEIPPFPQNECRITSPDGKYQAVRVIEDGWGRGGVDLYLPDGSVKRLFTAVVVDDSGKTHINDAISYIPRAFLDNTHLLYTMTGYEWPLGFGIYDAATGENVLFPAQRAYHYRGTHDGAIYASEPTKDDMYVPAAYWKITADGQAVCLRQVDEGEGDYVCLGSCWMRTVIDGDMQTLLFYTPDLDGELATVDLPAAYTVNVWPGVAFGNAFAYATDETLYLFVPEAAGQATTKEPVRPLDP